MVAFDAINTIILRLKRVILFTLRIVKYFAEDYYEDDSDDSDDDDDD